MQLEMIERWISLDKEKGNETFPKDDSRPEK